MSYFRKIINIEDSFFHQFAEIYRDSFPVYEQRNLDQQIAAFGNKNYNLYYIADKNIMNFFVSFWNFEKYIYIEHLAVNKQFRGKNIGTDSLKRFIKEIGKTVILEIDPVTDEVSEKRLRFYMNLGFNLNPYNHLHPAYNPAYPPHSLLVLSTGNILLPEQYEIFKNDLDTVVMKF